MKVTIQKKESFDIDPKLIKSVIQQYRYNEEENKLVCGLKIESQYSDQYLLKLFLQSRKQGKKYSKEFLFHCYKDLFKIHTIYIPNITIQDFNMYLNMN